MSNLSYKQYISKLDTLFDTLCKLYFGCPATIIGEQIWMTNNLDVETFRNGDPIPHITSDDVWKEYGRLGKPAFCYYQNSKSLGEEYGRLYNWHAINDPRGLAPSGWHVPSDAEWTTLINYLGGEYVAGDKMKSPCSYDENATNESGFSAISCSGRHPNGKFIGFGNHLFHNDDWIISNGTWWTSTESLESVEIGFFRKSSHLPYARMLGLDFGTPHTIQLETSKGYGFSVRCLRD